MQFGEFQLDMISDGLFKLDGGAMFGVVPKVLWERTNPANDKNRILLGLNSLLIRNSEETVLVDTGIGNRFDEKFAAMFEVEKPTDLLQGLQSHHLGPEDVTKVILTHLHFDHSGWNCRRNDSGELVPTFPNATYYFQRGEFEYAQNPDKRSRASYLPQNWDAIRNAGLLELVAGNVEIMPGIEVFITGGHTEYHQIVKINSGGKTACFLADMVPTSSHLKTPYVMGYDLYPKTTMEMKEKVLQQALKENWLLFFEHAPKVKAGYLTEDEGRMKLEKIEA